MADPFDWIDTKRIDWLPGQERKKARVHIREGTIGDIETLFRLFKVKRPVLQKWLQFNGWTVRIAARNQRYPAGVVIAHHTERENIVLRTWFSDLYEKPAFMTKLLLAAALEQPEVPTVIEVAKGETELISVVESLGWNMDDLSDDTNTYRSEPWKPMNPPQ